MAGRIKLIQDTLRTAEEGLTEHRQDNDMETVVMPTLQACKKKAENLECLLREVAAGEGTSWFGRYCLAIRALRKKRAAERLMRGIRYDVDLLTGNYTVKALTGNNTGQPSESTEEAAYSPLPPPSPGNGATIGGVYNYGTGPQNIHSGSGTQINNNGSGSLFSGTFQAPFHFALPP